MAKRVFEGSPADMRQDRAGARRTGKSLKAYEKTPQDMAEDRKGQAALGKKPPPPGFNKGGRVGRRGR